MKNGSPFFKKKLKNFCLLKNFDLNWVTNRVNSQNQISNFLCRLNQKDFQLLHLFDRQIVWDGKPGWDGKQETRSIHRLFRCIFLHHTIKEGIVHNFLYAPKKNSSHNNESNSKYKNHSKLLPMKSMFALLYHNFFLHTNCLQ